MSFPFFHFTKRKRVGFTLIELLVVIAILAILSTVIVVVINPGELLKQGRDTDRLTDLASLNRAIGLLLVDQPSVSLGRSQTVYVSIPDSTISGTSTSTCTSLGLPMLPTGYTYECHSPDTFRKVDGTGWIPINLQSLSTGSPIPVLPTDPTNSTTTRQYYVYSASSTQGIFKLSTIFESTKYDVKASSDGGIDPVQYEIGSNLSLTPFTHGLIAYWKLDETSGGNAYDSSGYGNTLSASAIGSTAAWNSGKVGNAFQLLASAKTSTSSCPTGLSISGMGSSNILYSLPQNNFSIAMWTNISAGGALFHLYTSYTYPGSFYGIWGRDIAIEAANALSQYTPITGYSVPKDSAWHHVVYVFNISGGIHSLYLDGALQRSSQNLTSTYGQQSSVHFGIYDTGWCGVGHAITGYLDEIRIYNRALSATDILTLYNETK